MVVQFHTYAVGYIHLLKVDFVVNTGASISGWGATGGYIPIGGVWKSCSCDKSYHIYYLEIKTS